MARSNEVGVVEGNLTRFLTMSLRVILDDREKFVYPFAQIKFADDKDRLIRKRLTKGDSAIVKDKDKILVVFERKTLKDYSAGIRDGRYENVSELIKLRNDTGCLIVFIIEHKISHPSLTKKFGGIQFKSLLASIDLLIFRSGIHVIWTKDHEHTAERLHDFYMRYVKIEEDAAKGRISASLRHVPPPAENGAETKSVVNVESKSVVAENSLITEIKLEKGDKTSGGTETKTVPDVPASIAVPVEKDDDRLIKKMWHTIAGGLSYNVASIISTKFTVVELVESITQAELKKLTYDSGTKFSTKIIKTLVSVKNKDKDSFQKLVAGIPRIGKVGAQKIIEVVSVDDLLNLTPAKINDVEIDGKRITAQLESIKRYFNYKTSAQPCT